MSEEGVLGKTQEIILASWRQSTKKQYRCYLQKWILFTHTRSIDPLHPNLGEVLEFLTLLFDSGLKYSALNTARSALSSFVSLTSGKCLGEERLIRKFMKGVFNLRPALPRYQESWNVDTVLIYLSNMPELQELSLKEISFKLVMILALITGQRCQTLHLLDLQDMLITETGVTFSIRSLVKQSKPGTAQPILKLNAYPNNANLCVMRILREYLCRTKVFRSTTKLFISFIRPYGAVSKDTLARWIRTVMKNAGIDITIFKPHSTRAASTSRAASKNIPVRTIMNTAGWSRQSTFAKFYHKPILHNTSIDESEQDTSSCNNYANAILE